MTDRPDICVLMNSGSGKRDASDLPDRIKAAFSAAEAPVTLKVLEHGRDIVPAAKKCVAEGYRTIVAAGGDGTICAVATALQGSGKTMGILPLGTFNYFARSLHLPERVEEAVEIVVNGAAKPVRIATINDRIFLNNTSLGAYPAILRTREDIYKRWGRSRIAAYWSVLKTIVTLRKPLHLTIEIGGEQHRMRTPLAFAVNNAFQLEQIGLQGGESIAAGELVLFVSPDTGRWGMLRSALSLAVGKAQRYRDFHIFAASEIKMETRQKSRQVACDGERTRMKSPFRLKVLDNDLTVMVPDSVREKVR